MERTPQQHNLVLILARAFAAQLATAVFLVDAEGTVIYYNEAAERLVGTSVHRGGGDDRGRVVDGFHPRDEEGVDGPRPGRSPLGTTMLKREPAHGIVTIRTADGVDRRIEVAAFPLFAHTEDFVGAIALFWPPIEEDRP